MGGRDLEERPAEPGELIQWINSSDERPELAKGRPSHFLSQSLTRPTQFFLISYAILRAAAWGPRFPSVQIVLELWQLD